MMVRAMMREAEPAALRAEALRLMAVGAVAIGRNEGSRLDRCLRSLLPRVRRVVYVDSGSSDGSVALARSLGVVVVELGGDEPYTAARARNAGIARLLALEPTLRWVQVIDADCELSPGWLEAASRRLSGDPRLAAVCGRRREREPGVSVFHRLMDMEWDTPVGEVASCGGDAMFRLSALRAVGGYDGSLVCGEEPELCVRLRGRGYRIERLRREMTRHDAAMTQWRQWWRRCVRGGWACAQGAAMHGSSATVRRSRGIWWWGLVLPLGALLLAGRTRGWSLALLLGYVVQGGRVYVHRRGRQGDRPGHAALYALFCMLGKFPEAVGQAWYVWHRLRGGRARLIEYKRAAEGNGERGR